jgi:hypothetical protein
MKQMENGVVGIQACVFRSLFFWVVVRCNIPEELRSEFTRWQKPEIMQDCVSHAAYLYHLGKVMFLIHVQLTDLHAHHNCNEGTKKMNLCFLKHVGKCCLHQ